MNFESVISSSSLETPPRFPDQTAHLISRVNTLDIEDLMTLMKISRPLAEENHKRFRDFSSGKDPARLRPALFALTGDVYKGLDALSFTGDDKTQAESSLRILSGLYGLLSPFTLIEPYRFEMGLKININGFKKTSDFWKSSVTDELNRQLDQRNDKHIIDLASAEYMAAIDKKKLKGRIIDVVFRENKDGKLKTIAIYSKRARGLMARFIVKEKVEAPEALKAFNTEGYCFNDSLSDDQTFIFIRKR